MSDDQLKDIKLRIGRVKAEVTRLENKYKEEADKWLLPTDELKLLLTKQFEDLIEAHKKDIALLNEMLDSRSSAADAVVAEAKKALAEAQALLEKARAAYTTEEAVGGKFIKLEKELVEKGSVLEKKVGEIVSSASDLIDKKADEVEVKLRGELLDSVERYMPKLVATTTKGMADGEKSFLPIPRKVSSTYLQSKAGLLVARSIKSKKPLMLSGPSGSGKSYVAEQELNKAGIPYFILSCADGLRLSDFTARQEIRDGETRWQLGALALSMKYGLAIILDEMDSIQPELAQILLRALEYRELLIPQTNEVIKAHPDWVCFATCNSLRDETGGYAGVRPSTALLNRFTFAACDYMTIPEEISILTSLGLDKAKAEKVVHALTTIRPLHIARQVSMAPSTRIAIQIAREMMGHDDQGNAVNKPLTFKDALEFCFVGALPNREVQNLKKAGVW